jgi:hypothetical protein
MSDLSKQYESLTKPKNVGLAGFAVLLVIGLAIFFFQAWILMLILGGLSTFTAIPALGYGQTMLVVLFLNVIAGIFRGIRS